MGDGRVADGRVGGWEMLGVLMLGSKEGECSQAWIVTGW
jgi:hypothetical protein